MIKSVAIIAMLTSFSIASFSQQTAGKITYARTMQLQIVLAGDAAGMENMMPKSRTEKYELTFSNNKSLWKQMEEEPQEEMAGAVTGGFQIKTFSFGSEDVTYSNLDEMMKTDLRELGTKKYIVSDTIKRGAWKLSDETKTILGHLCRKATSQKIGKRVMMNIDNGKMERKEIDDTSNIVAWFAADIPVSVGPAEFQGQLPGAVLEVDINNGKTTFIAVEVTEKADLSIIKEPKSGKKTTQAEFVKERQKMMDEMERNNGGPGRTVIRAGN
jgi:GLPGLI family protein